MFLLLCFLWLCATRQLLAYVPAHGVNGTQNEAANGLNVSDSSHIHLQWFSGGLSSEGYLSFQTVKGRMLTIPSSYWETISYQLVGSGSQGVSQVCSTNFHHFKLILRRELLSTSQKQHPMIQHHQVRLNAIKRGFTMTT